MHLVQIRRPPANAQPPLHFISQPRLSARPNTSWPESTAQITAAVAATAPNRRAALAPVASLAGSRLAAARAPPNWEAAAVGFGASGGPAAHVGFRRVLRPPLASVARRCSLARPVATASRPRRRPALTLSNRAAVAAGPCSVPMPLLVVFTSAAARLRRCWPAKEHVQGSSGSGHGDHERARERWQTTPIEGEK